MPSTASLTIADSVPANHVYEPVQVTPAKALFLNKATSIPASNEQVVLGFNIATAARATDKVFTNLFMPFEKTVDGEILVRSTARFFGQWVTPADMSDQERADFVALVQNMIGHASVAGYVTDRDPFY